MDSTNLFQYFLASLLNVFLSQRTFSLSVKCQLSHRKYTSQTLFKNSSFQIANQYRAVAHDVRRLRDLLLHGKRSLESVWKIVFTMVGSCCAYNCITREIKETREAGNSFIEYLLTRLNEPCGSRESIRRTFVPLL